jgi:hypothetical protein
LWVPAAEQAALVTDEPAQRFLALEDGMRQGHFHGFRPG